MATPPSAPILATTVLAMVWPLAKLMLEASGRDVPVGNTASHPPIPVGSVTVTLRTTDEIPVAGRVP
jgi:hypothetical protein